MVNLHRRVHARYAVAVELFARLLSCCEEDSAVVCVRLLVELWICQVGRTLEGYPRRAEESSVGASSG